MLIMDNQNSQNVWEEYHAYLPFCSTDDEATILKGMLEQDHRFTACIVCGADIAQPYFGGRTRRFCDRAGCRKRGSRLMRKFRRWCWERRTKARLRQYWQELLPDNQQELENLLSCRWITTEAEEGTSSHRNVDIAESVTRMIEAERRAAWRKVERYTVIFEQRAEKAEERVEELEQELKALRRLLPGALHEEIEKQPRYISVIDSTPANPRAVTATLQEEDSDRARVLAVLAQAGIPTIEEALNSLENDEEGDPQE